ncbi:MAG: hypothetical protein M1379_02570 [Firmicutes bacterium]|nr:hypothetical protein [Bacillota bacterium]
MTMMTAYSLRTAIVSHRKYEELGDRIKLHFGNRGNDEEIKNCVKLIRTYLRQHSDRDGFISYHEAAGAVTGAQMALEKANAAADGVDFPHSLDLYLASP